LAFRGLRQGIAKLSQVTVPESGPVPVTGKPEIMAKRFPFDLIAPWEADLIDLPQKCAAIGQKRVKRFPGQ